MKENSIEYKFYNPESPKLKKVRINLYHFNTNQKQKNSVPKHYSEITIRGKNIRFVHIPDEIDMISALQRQVLIRNKFKKNEFKKKPRNPVENKWFYN